MDEDSFKEWRDRVNKFMADTNQYLFLGNGKPSLIQQIADVRREMREEFSAIRSSNELSAQVAMTAAKTVKEAVDKRWIIIKRIGVILIIATSFWDLFGSLVKEKLHLLAPVPISANSHVTDQHSDDSEQRSTQ